MSDKEPKTKTQKKSKISELKKKSINEMTLEEARIDLQIVTLQSKMGEEKDTSKISKLRKRIARLLTEKNIKKI